MQLRVTVVDPLGATGPVDALVEAPPGSTLGEVRDHLLQAVGRPPATGGTLWCADTTLDDAAPLGLPPLLDGVVITVGRPARIERRGLLELHVTAGPDSGAVHRLPPGEHGIGRAAQVAVRVEDPKVSRLHALLRVAPEGTVVADLGSTNGTLVDDRPVSRQGAPLAPGQALQVGDTLLRLVVPEPRLASCRADGEGHLLVNRPPRLLPPVAREQVTLPTRPPEPERLSFPLLALLVPLAAGLVLVLVTRNPAYLLFVLLSPAMLLGSHLGDRAGRRRGGRESRREYDVALARAREQVAVAVRAEEAARHATDPGAASLLLCATGPRPRLWERRPGDPDHLVLRVGIGDVPAAVEVQASPPGDAGEPARLTSVPVTLALGEVGVAGIAGPREQALSMVRSLVAQLAGWHSPCHLRLVVLAADSAASPDWEWARWLPHLGACTRDANLLVGLHEAGVRAKVDELLSVLDDRRRAVRDHGADATGGCTVLVLDGAATLRRLPGVARLLVEGPAVGLLAMCIDSDTGSLPAECRATLQITGEVATRLSLAVAGQAPQTDVVADGVSPVWAHRFARALAPLRDATPAGGGSELPTGLRLLDLLPLDATDATAVETSWRAAPRGTRVVLGVRPGGEPLVVDLSGDGPHALVGGTTGSGKSELLQTLVAGLAVANRPDEMSFLLIDYKGGAAFQECAGLPHTVGLVTDLDGHLTRRALASLGAELRRREAVLRAAGCRDVDELHRAGPPGGAVPRLVLVVDEFATLAEELPDFVGGLVGVAQRGRSLGVHLVLATQRPSGVVSADIRANTTLRVALRVTDAADSADVVDARDAADISPGNPGRAVARIGTGALQPFQCARVGGTFEVEGATPVTVRALPWPPGGDPPPQPVADHVAGPTDLSRLVRAVHTAAARLGAPPPPRPWLPPLADVLTLDQVPTGVATWSAPLGVSDRPAEQRQDPVVFDLEHGGHLLVAGSARSGRSTLLRTLAGSLAARFPVDDVHLYALDGGGSLACLAALPHCGAVVGRDETARGDRLLTRLVLEVERRLAELARAGLGSVAEQRAAVDLSDRLPWLVLLVDGWEAIKAAYDGVDHSRPIDGLLRLVREGPAAGLHVVVTGDRGLLTSQVASGIADRLLLRLADPADYAIAGVPPRMVPTAMPAGRGVLADVGAEVQVAVLDRAHDGRSQVAAMRRIAAASVGATEPPRHQPIRVRALPRRVAVGEIDLDGASETAGTRWALLGVGGDEAVPVGVDLAAGAPAFVVAGPPGSGRSTALGTVSRWLGRRGVGVVLVATDLSPLHGLAGEPGVVSCLGPGAGGDLADLLAGHDDGLVVLADDAEGLHDTPVEGPLTGLLRPSARRRHALVMAGSSVEMACLYRGLTVEARRGRSGLLLGAFGPAGGELLGVRAASIGETPPGRGLLVLAGATTPVQVAVDA